MCSIDAVLLFHLLQVRLSRLHIFLEIDLHLFWLVVETDQISVHEVEAIQLVASLFCIHNILVDHIRSAFRSVCVPSANLADGSEFAKEVEECGRIDVVGEVLDEEDAVGFRSELVASGHPEMLE